MIEILIGIVSGLITGTGMGGGTVLIALLTFVLGLDQHVAQATNLIFFIHGQAISFQQIFLRYFVAFAEK